MYFIINVNGIIYKFVVRHTQTRDHTWVTEYIVKHLVALLIKTSTIIKAKNNSSLFSSTRKLTIGK